MAKPDTHPRRRGSEADRSRSAVASDPIANPEVAFESPAAVAIDRDLTLDEKLAALANWEQSVRSRLASAQGVSEPGRPGVRDADLLARIDRARSSISQPQSGRWWLKGDAFARGRQAEDVPVLTPTEARQGSGRRMNYRILENSLFLAVIAALALYLWFYFA